MNYLIHGFISLFIFVLISPSIVGADRRYVRNSQSPTADYGQRLFHLKEVASWNPHVAWLALSTGRNIEGVEGAKVSEPLTLEPMRP